MNLIGETILSSPHTLQELFPALFYTYDDILISEKKNDNNLSSFKNGTIALVVSYVRNTVRTCRINILVVYE